MTPYPTRTARAAPLVLPTALCPPQAYGYPAKAAYNQSRIDLYDVINADAYGLGFSLGLGANVFGPRCALDETRRRARTDAAWPPSVRRQRQRGGPDLRDGGAVHV